MTERQFSIEELRACAERELGMRCSVYPRWVAAGKMTQDRANREVAQMRAIMALLKAEAEAWVPHDSRSIAVAHETLLVSAARPESGGGHTPTVMLMRAGDPLSAWNVYATRPAPPPAPMPAAQGGLL